MNTSGFTFQNSLEANNLVVSFPEGAAFDDISLKVLRNGQPDFMLPLSMTSINGVDSLKYRLTNSVALEYIVDESFKKSDFLTMFKSLIDPMTECRDWLLDYHYICVDPKYVYIERTSQKVYYVYIPEASYRTSDSDIIDFLNYVSTKVSIIDDPAFQVKVFKFFKGNNITLSELNELIDSELKAGQGIMGQSQQMTLNKRDAQSAISTGVQGDLSGSPIIPAAPAVAPIAPMASINTANQAEDNRKLVKTPQKQAVSANTDEDILSLLGRDKKDSKKEKKDKKNDKVKEKNGGFFSKKEKKKDEPLVQPVGTAPYSPDNSMVIGMRQPMTYGNYVMPENDNTETEDDSRCGSKCLRLESSPISGAVPVISLDFAQDHITIGRTSSDPVQPDVAFDKNFKRIGRRHARIDRRSDGYYIVDLGSQNKTLVNERPIFPNQPVKLMKGYTVTFTDSTPVKYIVEL